MLRRLIFLISLIVVLGLAGNAGAALVGHWRLDGDASDSSGNGNDGVLFGDPQWVAGKIGGALEFDGTDDRVEMPGTSPTEGFPSVDGEVTWALWFKTGSSTVGSRPVMALGPTGAAHVSGNRSITIENSGVIMVRAWGVGGLTSLTSSATVDDDEWHHIAVTIAFDTSGSSDPMKFYIDGDLSKGYEVDNVNINANASAADDFIVTLGARGGYYDGLIDDVRVYDHVLSEVEILAAMAAEPWPFAFGPSPADGALLEATWVNLSWRAGEMAVSHDVYFGDNFE
ncbi:MAG: LamG domain-containing protein, partial [Phycisphaerales bacterium]